MAVKQVIPKSESTVLQTSGSAWGNVLGGEHVVALTDTYKSQFMRIPVPIAGTFKNFTIYCNDNLGNDVTATLMVNGIATSLAVTILGGVKQGTNAVNTAAVVAGDDVLIQWTTPFGGVGGSGLEASFMIEFDSTTESVYGVSATVGAINAGACWFGGALGNGRFESLASLPANGGPYSNTYSICAAPGNIDKICIKEIAPTGSGGGWTAYLRKNKTLQDGTGGSVNTAVSLADGGGFTVGTFTLPVVLGDHIEIVLQRTGTNAPFSTGNTAVSVAFTPTTAGQFMFTGGNNDAFLNNVDQYAWVASGQEVTVENNTVAPAGVLNFTINSLYIETGDPTNVGSSITGTFRKNGAGTAATVTVNPGSSNGSITGLTVNVVANDIFTMLFHPAVTPIVTQFHWGLAGVATAGITTATLIVIKATNPPGLAQSFDFTTTGGLAPSTFSLTDGQSRTYVGLAAGTYGVTETAIAGWNVSYAVSNANPHTAIVLAGGDVVTVTITNTPVANTRSGIYKMVPGKRNDTLWLAGYTGTEDVKIP